MYAMLVLEFALAVTGVMSVTYLFYLVIFIQELQLGLKNTYKLTDVVREPRNICVFYRALQIFHENALCILGNYLPIIHVLLTTFFLFVNSIFITFWNELDSLIVGSFSVAYIACFVFWIFVLQIGKFLWIQGDKKFDSWSKVGFECNALEKKTMKKFRRSCRLIFIRHGNILVFGRMTHFVYIKCLIVYTCKILLAFKRLE